MDKLVRIPLHPSRIYSALLFTVTLLSIVTICMLPVDAGWRGAACAGVFALVARLFYRDVVLQAQQSCISLICGIDRQISLTLRSGEQRVGQVGGDTLVTPWLVLLNVATTRHGRRSLLLFPDAMPADDHRRLRVLLRNSECLQGVSEDSRF